MRKIKALGSVVVILALMMLVTPLTVSIVTTPKYGPYLMLRILERDKIKS